MQTSWSAALAAGALLGGCASSGGVTPSRAHPMVPQALASRQTLAQVAMSPASWPKADWWTRYGDPQLDALVAEVLADNPSLGAARARIDQAVALSGSAQASRNLQAGLTAKANQQRYSAHSTTPRPLAGTWDWFNDATLSASYDLDFWGRNKDQIEASLDRVRAAQIDTQAARLLLTHATVQAYFRLAQAHAQLDIAQSALVQRQKTLDLVGERLAAGLESTVELKTAQAALPPARQQVLAQGEIIELTRTELAALAGKGPDRGALLRRPTLALRQDMALPTQLPAELLGRRPDVMAQRWRVEATLKDVRVAKAQFYPNISLTAYVGYQSLGLNHWILGGSQIAGVGPAVSLPIFDGGRLRANLGARNAEHDLAVEQYNQTLVEALRDVVDKITAQRWFAQQKAQQVEAVETAQTALDLAQQRYDAGLTPYLPVLSAQTQLLTQQRQLVDLETRALQLDASLARALGGGAIERGTPPTSGRPTP